MNNKLREAVKGLSGNEAKTLLLHILLRLEMVLESQTHKDVELQELIQMVTDYSEYQKELPIQRDMKAIHIVCGESPAGSLRVGLGLENKVIGFPDFLDVGPIKNLYNDDSWKLRYEWVKDHLNFPDNFFEEEYEQRIFASIDEIRNIPEELPVILWTANNGYEQVGIRFIVSLLREKKNELFLINATESYKQFFNTCEYQYFLSHTGEAHPDKLNEIYEKGLPPALSEEKKQLLIQEWEELSKTAGILRLWKNGNICTVDEDYFDSLIVNTVRKIQEKKPNQDFTKAGRVIGEVYGDIDTNVGDTFLEYRLRNLIYSGVLEIKGVPKDMIHYSVRLRDN